MNTETKTVSDYLKVNYTDEIITSKEELVEKLIKNVYYTGGYLDDPKATDILYWDILDFEPSDDNNDAELQTFFDTFATKSIPSVMGTNYYINIDSLCKKLNNNYSDVYSLLAYVTQGLLGVF